MGIMNLIKFLKQNAPGCFKEVSILKLKEKTVAIDASIAMYQFLIDTQYVKKEELFEMKDSKGVPTGHLFGILMRTVWMLENNITPIWVFDGKYPEMKMIEIENRRLRKAKDKLKLDEAKKS